jgi:hypothetical protein
LGIIESGEREEGTNLQVHLFLAKQRLELL